MEIYLVWKILLVLFGESVPYQCEPSCCGAFLVERMVLDLFVMIYELAYSMIVTLILKLNLQFLILQLNVSSIKYSVLKSTWFPLIYLKQTIFSYVGEWLRCPRVCLFAQLTPFCFTTLICPAYLTYPLDFEQLLFDMIMSSQMSIPFRFLLLTYHFVQCYVEASFGSTVPFVSLSSLVYFSTPVV